MSRRWGRPPKYKTEKAFQDAIEKYLDDCIEQARRPNKAGLCLALGMSRETYNEYKSRFPDTLKAAELEIEEAWLDRLDDKAPAGAIFYLKNAFKEEYKDRHESDLTVTPASLTKDDIGIAIDKLPKEQQDALYVQLATALAGGNQTGGKA